MATREEGSPGDSAFDLSLLAAWAANSQRFGRWLFPVVTAVAVVLEIVVAVTRAAAHDYFGPGTIISLSAGGGFVVFGFFAMRMFGPAPERARVGPEALEFEFPNGRVSRYRWDNPRIHLRIRVWRDSRRLSVEFPFVHEFFPGGARPNFGISPELFAAIRTEASRHGLYLESNAGFDATKAESIDYTIKHGSRA